MAAYVIFMREKILDPKEMRNYIKKKQLQVLLIIRLKY